jgi:hypothetical protein
MRGWLWGGLWGGGASVTSASSACGRRWPVGRGGGWAVGRGLCDGPSGCHLQCLCAPGCRPARRWSHMQERLQPGPLPVKPGTPHTASLPASPAEGSCRAPECGPRSSPHPPPPRCPPAGQGGKLPGTWMRATISSTICRSRRYCSSASRCSSKRSYRGQEAEGGGWGGKLRGHSGHWDTGVGSAPVGRCPVEWLRCGWVRG